MSFAVVYIAQKYYTKSYKCPQPTMCYSILEGRDSHLILYRSNILLQPKNFPQCHGERCFCVDLLGCCLHLKSETTHVNIPYC